ncbi:MAG TPA: hypothetical protein VK146_10090, partial [Tabrizicola sp.]|nr:hypothetical protein [Tabrizicola sp.]
TLLKNPPILILDEATSALDTQTERSIQESLAEMGQGRSVITIAHRLSTIADADQILVMDEGRVVEQGTHEALLDLGAVYAAMWQRQIMEGEDFASEIVEFEGAKPAPLYTEREAARERNARAAPIG